MKGIIKYKQQLYKKSNNPFKLKKGDLIKLNCKRGSDYFKYNGIYEVDEYHCIHIQRDGELTLCLKLNYNILRDDYFKLVLTERKKSLPNVAKEDIEY